MPELLSKIFQGNFSSPLTFVFVIFSLLAFYFLFRLAWLFFAKGDEFVESAEGKKQTKNNVRLLVTCVLVALFSGFVFQLIVVGRDTMAASAPGAAKGFFDWLVGR
jgi:NADH:ubiquinone oxidoreductase subunit 2 (subunit N)